MKHRSFMQLFFVIVLSVFAIQAYPAAINVHWTPTICGGVSHGTTVSGNIWINLTEPMDSDQMTTQSISFTEGYIQEQSHNSPQVALSMSSATPPSCCGTNMMSVSMNPSVIYQLEHNASYKIYVKARITGFRMGMPPEQLTPYDVEQTVYVTGNNLLITQIPDYIISWDPATMTGVNLSTATTDAQTGLQQYKYTISGTGGSVEKAFNNQNRPGTHSFTWDGKNSLGTAMPKGLYSVKVNVYANAPTASGDCNRSSYLTVSDFSVEYAGYNGEHNFNLRYKLTDSLNTTNASSGYVYIYDKDTMNLIHTYTNLTANDLTSSSTGISHEKVMPLNIQLDDGKKYIAVLRCFDSDANSYKNHTNRPAMEAYAILSVPTAHNYGSKSRPKDDEHDEYDDYKLKDLVAAEAAYYQQDLIDGSAYRAYVNPETSASDALQISSTVTIFYIYGHGYDGLIVFKNGELTANGDNTSPNASVIQNFGCFANAKLVMYQGCKTGNVGDDGDLLMATVQAGGAELAIGFTEFLHFYDDDEPLESDEDLLSVNNPPRIFANTFWSDVTGNRIGTPASVSTALNTAKWAVFYEHYSFEGYDSYRLYPSNGGGMMLAPAANK